LSEGPRYNSPPPQHLPNCLANQKVPSQKENSNLFRIYPGPRVKKSTCKEAFLIGLSHINSKEKIKKAPDLVVSRRENSARTAEIICEKYAPDVRNKNTAVGRVYGMREDQTVQGVVTDDESYLPRMSGRRGIVEAAREKKRRKEMFFTERMSDKKRKRPTRRHSEERPRAT